MAPVAIQLSCATPMDDIRYVGMFMALGVFFAGISVGASTFGDEKGRPRLAYIEETHFWELVLKGQLLTRLIFLSCFLAVFWRDTSAGMPTLPYYMAKFLADVPRMVVAGMQLFAICAYN